MFVLLVCRWRGNGGAFRRCGLVHHQSLLLFVVVAAQVVKCTVLLLDIADYKAVNEVYGEFYNKKPFPARAAFAVKQLPANGAWWRGCSQQRVM